MPGGRRFGSSSGMPILTPRKKPAANIGANALTLPGQASARVGSIPIARSILRQCQATQGYKMGVKTLIRWESLGNRR
jgi:hypothetical protein